MIQRFLNAYGWQVAALILAGLCIAFGIFTFTNPKLFTLVTVGVFMLLGFYFRNNVNIIAICVILALESVVIFGVFEYYDGSLLFRILSYAFIIPVLWWLWSDKVTRIIALTLVISLCAETYWYFTDYEAPRIGYYFFKIGLYLIVRHMLIHQSQELAVRGFEESDFLRLDWFIYKTKGLACMIECLMIVEYLIRHLTPAKPLLLYQSYSYITQALGVWVFWLVLREAKKLFREKLLVA